MFNEEATLDQLATDLRVLRRSLTRSLDIALKSAALHKRAALPAETASSIIAGHIATIDDILGRIDKIKGNRGKFELALADATKMREIAERVLH